MAEVVQTIDRADRAVAGDLVTVDGEGGVAGDDAGDEPDAVPDPDAAGDDALEPSDFEFDATTDER